MPTPIWTSEPSALDRTYVEQLPAPLSRVLGATAEEAFITNPTTAVVNDFRLLNKIDSPHVSAADARTKAEEAGVRLNIPSDGVPEGILNYWIEAKKDEQKRQATLARGEGGFVNGLARFGVSAGVSLLDPINIASAFVPVVSEAKWAESLGQAASKLGRAGVRLRYGALEGAVGAAMVEPLVYSSMQFQQLDYGLADSLMNVAVGGALGGGLHMGAGAAYDAVKGDKAWWKAKPSGKLANGLAGLSNDERATFLRSAVAQIVEGKKVDIEAITPESLRFSTALRTTMAINGPDQPIRLALSEARVGGEDVTTYFNRVEVNARQQRPELFKQVDDLKAQLDTAFKEVSKDILLTQNIIENVTAAKGKVKTITQELRTNFNLDPAERQKLEKTRARLDKVIELSGKTGQLVKQTEKYLKQAQRQNPAITSRQRYDIAQVEAAAVRSDLPSGQMLFDENLLNEIDSDPSLNLTKGDVKVEDPLADITKETMDLTNDINLLAEQLGINVKDLEPTEDLAVLADAYGSALKALASCGLRRG